MGFIDDASELFDRGVSAAKGAVSNVACEQLGFVRAFIALCEEGWELGYHECNGGNASYRLSTEDISAADSFFYTNPSSWVPLEVTTPAMANQYLLVTAAGSYMKNVKAAPAINLGIVQIDENGSAWRAVWGLRDNGRPTSELSAHVAAHGARMQATNGASHVLYHAHPTSIAALTAIIPPDSREITRLLWKSLTESIIAFPEGAGVLSWMVPGSKGLAEATSEMFKTYPVCIWQLHGVMASASTCDAALGMVHTIDKAADAYLMARAAVGGDAGALVLLGDEALRATAESYNLPVRTSFLD